MGAGAGTAVADGTVGAVREFNRFYTNRVGLLRGKYLGTPYSLTEARVLFELARSRGATEVSDLRKIVDVDAGYLSRLLGRFETGGLVARERSEADGRRQVITLTEAGRSAFAGLDERSGQQVRGMLSRVPEQDHARLLDAMRVITDVLSDTRRLRGYLLRGLEPGDLGWVVQRHGALYAADYGWDGTFEALVASLVARFAAGHDPAREAAWIAEADGVRAGCVFCVRKDESIAQLRLLLVEPWARGLGIGARLVDEVLRFAKRAGYGSITLWTNDVLTSARRIYQGAGFTLDSEQPHHSYGKDLIGQDWSRSL
jgi:DNA-binding MarR family transcriptional regulator/N-acetylglutamate synthase-like GNAT family acetyltransferase